MPNTAVLKQIVKRQAKIAIARGLMLTGQARRARKAQAQQLRILMYHGVLPKVRGPAAYGDLFVSAKNFARQLRHLKLRYNPMSLNEVVAAIKSQTPFPPRAVAVTIDDGYRNTLTAALPALSDLRVPATVFVPTDLIGSGRYLWFDCLRLLVWKAHSTRERVELAMGILIDGTASLSQEQHFLALNRRVMALPAGSRAIVQQEIQRLTQEKQLLGRFSDFELATWEELRLAAANGVLSVGSHALAHGDLTELDYGQQTQEMRASRERIERELSLRCDSVAYPYGLWNDNTLKAVREAGYACAVTIENGFNGIADDPFRLSRTMAGDKGNFSIFCARLSGTWENLKRINE